MQQGDKKICSSLPRERERERARGREVAKEGGRERGGRGRDKEFNSGQ